MAHIEDYFERLARLYRNQVYSWTVGCFETITNLDDVVSSSFNLIQSSTYIKQNTDQQPFSPMFEIKRKLKFNKRHAVRLRLVWAHTSSLIKTTSLIAVLYLAKVITNVCVCRRSKFYRGWGWMQKHFVTCMTCVPAGWMWVWSWERNGDNLWHLSRVEIHLHLISWLPPSLYYPKYIEVKATTRMKATETPKRWYDWLKDKK